MSEAIVDVREGGRWTLAQRAKNDCLYLAVIAALALARRVPLPLLRTFGRGLGAFAHLAIPKARRIALANVRRAFPDLGETEQKALVRRAYRVLGGLLGEAAATLDPARSVTPLPFAPGAREAFADAIAAGRGVVFASAHLGPWERVAASLVAAGIPLTVVAREAYDPRLTPIYERLRGGRGVRVIWRGAPGASTGLLRTLRRGEVLGIPMDLASRVPSIDAPFFGIPAPTPVGPARLALRTGAAVVVGAATRDGTIAARRLAPCASEEELTAAINEALGERIRAFPEAWVWMHERFPTL